MAKCPIVFAHGAGAGPDSPFMTAIAEALRVSGHPVHTFMFPYWQQVQETGRMRPPNPAAQLDEAMLNFCESLQLSDFVVMGKSMGARVAFRVADRCRARAAIALGFPFHPPGKELKHRLNDLYNQRPKNLIIQGERDPFGKRAWVEAQTLPENMTCVWASNGDHDLLATKRVQQQTGETASMRWQWAAQQVTEWVETNT
ncbi:alpha/beta hydrolase [Aliidiomarina taiwanensis]|uniref:Alpha/beta hydrolase n=1 Tax=Aliidiomarina taiwanensis TaxID=946228 RepID=A0A432XAG5_9GAMM|nr:alpha/beta family hydrolase [Aliidiomarina taiwanensis]RUO44377.1 alpha/beta hydrolase [Aliidiomarina taiwanensis]